MKNLPSGSEVISWRDKQQTDRQTGDFISLLSFFGKWAKNEMWPVQVH
jgi:hypothetical protein